MSEMVPSTCMVTRAPFSGAVICSLSSGMASAPIGTQIIPGPLPPGAAPVVAAPVVAAPVKVRPSSPASASGKFSFFISAFQRFSVSVFQFFSFSVGLLVPWSLGPWSLGPSRPSSAAPLATALPWQVCVLLAALLGRCRAVRARNHIQLAAGGGIDFEQERITRLPYVHRVARDIVGRHTQPDASSAGLRYVIDDVAGDDRFQRRYRHDPVAAPGRGG